MNAHRRVLPPQTRRPRPPSALLEEPGPREREWYSPGQHAQVRIAPIPGPGRHRQDALGEPEEPHDSRWWLVLHVVFISLWAAVLVVLVARLLAIYLRLPDHP